MECWGYYCYYPVPVDVDISTGTASVWAWLGPVLLFAASLAASGIAYLGIRKSNATNQAAITAADNRASKDRTEARARDFRAWQRDTLLRVGAEAMQAAYAIQDEYRAIAHEAKPDSVLPRLDTIELEGKRIWETFTVLRLIGAHDAAEKSRSVREALGSRSVQSASLDAHRSYRRSQESTDPNDLTYEVETNILRQVLAERLDTTMEALGRFADTIEAELEVLTSLSDTDQRHQRNSGSTGTG